MVSNFNTIDEYLTGVFLLSHLNDALIESQDMKLAYDHIRQRISANLKEIWENEKSKDNFMEHLIVKPLFA